MGVSLWSIMQRRDDPAVAGGGNVTLCSQLKGDEARACYSREVGRDLAAVGATVPRAVFAADTGGSVTFAAEDSAALLCDLHLRVGVTNANKPSWVTWAEPLS